MVGSVNGGKQQNPSLSLVFHKMMIVGSTYQGLYLQENIFFGYQQNIAKHVMKGVNIYSRVSYPRCVGYWQSIYNSWGGFKQTFRA